MVRQSTQPVQFERQTRADEGVLMTSGRAAKVVPVMFAPVLRGDSCAGSASINIELAEMPRPLKNAVIANVQAWFVPKSAHPQFSGMDEFMASYQGEKIQALGFEDRDPPSFYLRADGADKAVVLASELFNTLGIHHPDSTPLNCDIIETYNLIYNFRLASMSNKLERRKYSQESFLDSTTLANAFWPSNRFTRVVPDYERALLLGNIDFDLIAGHLPVTGIGTHASNTPIIGNTISVNETGKNGASWENYYNNGDGHHTLMKTNENGAMQVWAEMAGQTMSASLADIDSARKTRAFAQLRAQYAGTDATGFSNEDTLLAELMQGFSIPPEQFNRPILLDAQKAVFGMQRRYATDSANLDQSVSVGNAGVTLALNLPRQETGGAIMITVEVMPERIHERQADESTLVVDPDTLPNALRDVQRTEPVDFVRNRRLDAAHTDPLGGYGWEPMNDQWDRSFTRLGGIFYQDDPSLPFQESRAGIWQTGIVNPYYTRDHFVAPDDFPHDVFSDTLAPAFEVSCRHNISIRGLTQIGDVLVENNDDYAEVQNEI